MTRVQAYNVVEAASEGAITEYLTVTTIDNHVTSTVCITDRRRGRQARYIDFQAAMAHVHEAAESVQSDVLAQARYIVRVAEAHHGTDNTLD